MIPWVKFAIEPVLRAQRKRKTLYGKTRKEAMKKLARALSDREGGPCLRRRRPQAPQNTTCERCVRKVVGQAVRPPQVHREKIQRLTPEQARTPLDTARALEEALG